MNDDTFNAWAAGFFDGEGSLTVYLLHRHGRPASTVEIRLTVQVSQQCQEPLDLLKAKYGGYIGEYSNGRRKTYWKWSLVGRGVTSFLLAIKPYSIVKAAQIITGLEVLGLQKFRGAVGGRLPSIDGVVKAKQFYTPEEMAHFTVLRHRMMALNANS